MSEEPTFEPLSDEELSQRLEQQLAALRPQTHPVMAHYSAGQPRVTDESDTQNVSVDSLFGALLDEEAASVQSAAVNDASTSQKTSPEVFTQQVSYDALPMTEPLHVSNANSAAEKVTADTKNSGQWPTFDEIVFSSAPVK